jgi:hypothetical protein
MLQEQLSKTGKTEDVEKRLLDYSLSYSLTHSSYIG